MDCWESGFGLLPYRVSTVRTQNHLGAIAVASLFALLLSSQLCLRAVPRSKLSTTELRISAIVIISMHGRWGFTALRTVIVDPSPSASQKTKNLKPALFRNSTCFIIIDLEDA